MKKKKIYIHGVVFNVLICLGNVSYQSLKSGPFPSLSVLENLWSHCETYCFRKRKRSEQLTGIHCYDREEVLRLNFPVQLPMNRDFSGARIDPKRPLVPILHEISNLLVWARIGIVSVHAEDAHRNIFHILPNPGYVWGVQEDGRVVIGVDDCDNDGGRVESSL